MRAYAQLPYPCHNEAAEHECSFAGGIFVPGVVIVLNRRITHRLDELGMALVL